MIESFFGKELEKVSTARLIVVAAYSGGLPLIKVF